MSSMRAGADKNVTLSAKGEEALDDLAQAMAATYDGSAESLDRLLRVLNAADVDDFATDLCAAANDTADVDAVARRRLDAEQDPDIPQGGATDRQVPSYGW